jgi:hypothetical protein
MPLPISWVDALFGRLSLRYGNAFLRQWPDGAVDAVKADWADVLDGITGEAIGYALRYLPESPPNAIKFRDQCRRMPAPELPALPAPDIKADPQRVQAALAGIKRDMSGDTPAQRCADWIMFLVGDRGRFSAAQKFQIRAMWHLLTPEQHGRLIAIDESFGKPNDVVA